VPLPVNRPIHVLLVDDEPGIIEVGAIALRMAGIKVTATTDPERALLILGGLEEGVDVPDVLVTDLVMPLLSGARLVATARELGVEVPTLVISAYGTGEDILGLLRVGLDDCLDKPLNASVLVARVKAMASRGLKRRQAWRPHRKPGRRGHETPDAVRN
jgi:DNA-binding response OmpR family regulator